VSGSDHHGYDPEARRDTPLALRLKERIRRDGPITLAQYMDACLQDEEHGYYRKRQAIGRGGDFITAPEISQVFGELLGLWAAVVWQQVGSPGEVNLVELGPGRGTLMRDALRAAGKVPGFVEALRVHLVETSEALREEQRRVLADAGVAMDWHERLGEVPAGPAIVLANELLDTIPVHQFEIVEGGAYRRGVALGEHERLQFVRLEPKLPIDAAAGRPGDVSETQDFAALFELNRMMAAAPVAALFIDYGHMQSAAGDTLQAVRNHRFEHALCSPGEADLTVHVDFAHVRTYPEMGQPAKGWPAGVCDGPITQAEFLGRLGILQRASRLMAANPAKAHEIETGAARLMSPTGMGSRFKVLGVRSAGLPTLPGFV